VSFYRLSSDFISKKWNELPRWTQILLRTWFVVGFIVLIADWFVEIIIPGFYLLAVLPVVITLLTLFVLFQMSIVISVFDWLRGKSHG